MIAKIKRLCPLRIALTALISCCVVIAGGPIAWAQKGLDKAAVMGILRSGTIPDQKEFDDYFNKSFLPQFESSAGPVDKFFRLRVHLKAFQTTGKSGQAHDQLNKLVMAKMKSIVGKADHAARVNAIIVISELNESDEAGKVKPLPEAFTLLWAVVQSKHLKDELKIPAMAGIERFAALGAIPSAKKDAVSKFMLDLVKQSTPPGTRSPDGQYWIRRSAAQILARLGSPGPGNSVVNALRTIAADPKERPMLRCEMAQLIGQLKYPAAAKVDLQALSSAVGHSTIDICNQEIESAKAAKHGPNLQLIMYALFSAREGLAGLQSSAADTPHKKFVSDAYTKLKAIHADLDDPDLSEDSAAAEVSQKLKDLQAVLGPPASAVKEVATAAAKEKPAESVKQ